MVDLVYYSSSGFYMSTTFRQLWPVTVHGKSETLIWRWDMVSSPELQNLHGVEKMAASSLMLSDMKKAITAFRQDLLKPSPTPVSPTP
jgi:hypothetical protein